MMKPLRLALDWDGTVTAFPAELALLAKAAGSVVVITLNLEVTRATAAHLLDIPEDRLEIVACPKGARHYYDIWKADVCTKMKMDLMIDDDDRVIEACFEKGIRAILVGKAPPRPAEC